MRVAITSPQISVTCQTTSLGGSEILQRGVCPDLLMMGSIVYPHIEVIKGEAHTRLKGIASATEEDIPLYPEAVLLQPIEEDVEALPLATRIVRREVPSATRNLVEAIANEALDTKEAVHRLGTIFVGQAKPSSLRHYPQLQAVPLGELILLSKPVCGEHNEPCYS